MHDWSTIETRYRAAVWSAVIRILLHEDDARDCAQDVFMEAMEYAQTRSVRNWGGFLRWLATRRAIDRLRRRQRDHSRTVPLSSAPPVDEPRDILEQAELSEVVRAELTRLPESQATAFWLSAVEDLSYEEIAALTDVSVNAVGLRIHRARERLRLRLAAAHPETSDHSTG